VSLILLVGGLASLELLEVPVANAHVALLLIHAAVELLESVGAGPGLLLLLGVLSLCGRDGRLGSRSGLGRAAREPAANGVTD
jgi:hypothetical protein